MGKSTSVVRTGLLAVLLAMVGFSYSLATSNSDVASGEVAARALGSTLGSAGQVPLQYTNPFVAGPGSDRDLGDAVAGSALTRLIRAKGGVAPYTFSTAGTATTALTALKLQLLSNGLLTTIGTAVGSALPGPFIFAVTVKDSFGTAPHSVTENFRLTFTNTTLFRFSMDSLPSGVQFQPYAATIATINGKGPVTFTATGLSGTGLGLSTDGSLYGVPVAATTLTITVTATDANNKKAAARNGTGTSQTFVITVSANKTLASVFSVTTMTVKAGFPKSRAGVGADGVMCKGVANLGAEGIAALSGKAFGFRVGSYTGPTANFDGKGNALTARGLVPAVKASVKKFGLVNITISKDVINLGTITGSTVNLPVEVILGDAVIGTEFLQFAVKTSNKGGVTLTYKGGAQSDLGGSAQLLKVQGADDRGATGDAWKVSFTGRFPLALSAASATAADIAIGSNYINTVQLTNKNGKLSAKGDKKTPVIAAFSLDTVKGKGSYTTGVLPKTLTTIPLAGASSGTPQAFFATGITLGAGTTVNAGVISSLAIFPKRTAWHSQ